MLKKIFLLLMVAMGVGSLHAAGFPTISTEGNEVWYLIQFMNGGNAITATTDGAQISTTSALGSDEQLWKITGSEAEGYTLTNKKGLTLYTASGVLNNMVSAASTPGEQSTYSIVPTGNSSYSGGYEIQPKNNATVSMNLWGGPSENRGVGLWTKDDQNNPVTFTEAKSLENAAKISIVPYPASLNVVKDGGLDLQALKAITYPNDEVRTHVEDFATQLQKASGLALEVKESTAAEADGISLVVNETLPAEGYTLVVSDEGIVISASQAAGFFYALQTLKQLLPRAYFSDALQEGVAWEVPYVEIADQPLLEHRGFMMDVARHFFNKDEVKRVLDIMALYKMNRFHWHLTDDQGWRIEIPEYPLLTEMGAVRSGSFTSLGDGTKFYDDTEYGRGMWFSKEDLKEIVAYAKARHIEIMPEVDLPGHMVAAVTAYPSLSCDSTKTYSVRIDGGISEDVLNVGDDKVIDFLKCVLDNLADVFPYPYVHIGGDECPTTQWATNEDCLRRVREEGLSGVEQLQSWLVEELGTYVKEKHGKDIVVWDELLSHWNSGNQVKPVIMAWNNISKSKDAADKGFRSIVVPYQALYLDFMQVPVSQRLVDEPYYGGWGDNYVNSLETVYALNPLASLSGKESYCMGVQGNLWAETLNDFGELQYQLLPRMLALAEIGWLPAADKSWASFYNRLQQQDEILDALGYTYAKHYIEQPQLTEAEAALAEAESILSASKPGEAGYPSQEAYGLLEAAAAQAAAAPEDGTLITALQEQLTTYKNAAITQPQAGKIYQILSASTYYKKQFAGSTLYQQGTSARFHYTPQVEPEELWEFVPSGTGFVLRNLCTGAQMQLPAVGNAVVLAEENGTPVRVDKATIATANYTYIPGVVTISAVSGYNPAVTGSVKRLCAELSGQVYVRDEAALCYPGTWTLVEVTDFSAQLQGLVNKCESIFRTAKPGGMNQPTAEAIAFLTEQVYQPAQAALEAGAVTEETYKSFLAAYNQYLAMPRTSVLDAISSEHYYFIQNAYFTNYYACANASTGAVEPKTLDKANDGFYWMFAKNSDGTTKLLNKATGKVAYIGNSSTGSAVSANYAGSGQTDWTVEEIATDLGSTGYAIVDPTAVYSWYTNPSAYATILLQPKDWGASIWNFVETATPTGVPTVAVADGTTVYYDLSGRRVAAPRSGSVYVTAAGEKVLWGK